MQTSVRATLCLVSFLHLSVLSLSQIPYFHASVCVSLDEQPWSLCAAVCESVCPGLHTVRGAGPSCFWAPAQLGKVSPQLGLPPGPRPAAFSQELWRLGWWEAVSSEAWEGQAIPRVGTLSSDPLPGRAGGPN